MARIPEAEIERLKEAVPVARLVEASGIELKKGGKDREWRWLPGDKWHNPHWDHNPHNGPSSPWVNVPHGGLPPVKP